MVAPTLSQEERDGVTAAVTAAEAGTDGEIVTIVTRRSDPYHDVGLHYALAGVLAVAAVAAVWPNLIAGVLGWFDNGWSEPTLTATLFALLILQTLAFLLVRFALAWMPLRIALTPAATKSRRVRRRAVQYFKVGAERRTVARVGVLLFLSLDERRAEIVADEAIHGKVPPERWGEAMAALVDEVRHGRAGAGMIAAVAQVGTIVAEHFPKTADDANELPDRLIEL